MQEEDLLLVQEEDLPVVHEEDLLLVREENLLLVREEDLLLAHPTAPWAVWGQGRSRAMSITPGVMDVAPGLRPSSGMTYEVYPSTFNFLSNVVLATRWFQSIVRWTTLRAGIWHVNRHVAIARVV